MIQLARRLRAAGVLGLNRRNADFVGHYNPRRLYPLVDDKVLTKELALAAGIAVPELYGVISEQHEVRSVVGLMERHDRFVAKPAHGSGGNGIVVITGRRRGQLQLAGGRVIEEDELLHHVSGALSGLYSLGGQRDRVLFEYCVQPHEVFAELTWAGVPDVRLIVLRGFPVMAMVRFPTRQSDGKANLHQGAVGAGIDIASGITIGGVQGNDAVDEHPDTGQPIAGLQIPGWASILELGARAWEICGLGYLGVDIVIDRHLGPLILELNARPGMNIQIANRSGLLDRLRVVEDRAPQEADCAERVRFCRECFASACPLGRIRSLSL